TVDVRGWAENVPAAGGLFRTHVRRRPHRRAQLRALPDHLGYRGRRRFRSAVLLSFSGFKLLGQAPIDHQHFAVLAEHNVLRLEVAVDHPAAVGVSDRLADRHEVAQQLPQGQAAFAGVAVWRVDEVELRQGLTERLPLDEAHGVAGLAVYILNQPVD